MQHQIRIPTWSCQCNQCTRIRTNQQDDSVTYFSDSQSRVSVEHSDRYDFDALDAHAPEATGDFVVSIGATGGISVF
jgi:hypothetical protein